MTTTLISFIIVLGVLIFIHELGHFAVAKLGGVGVEKFSLGFGPRLAGVKTKETDYMVSLVPLGGYVKMVGGDFGEEQTDPADRHRSFIHKPIYIRVLIVAAGPFMNLALALFLLPLIFMIGVPVPAFLGAPAFVGYVTPKGAAAKAGIKAGDVIASIDGEKIKDWEGVMTAPAFSAGKLYRLTVLRGSSALNLTVTPAVREDAYAGYAGILPPMPPVIGEVTKGNPAKEAGIIAGDEITMIDGVPISHWAELEAHIQKDGGRKKTFTVKREGKAMDIVLAPKFDKDADKYIVGIIRKEETVKRFYGFFEGVDKGVKSAVNMTGQLFVVIKGLFTGKFSLKTLGGPIQIAQVAGKAAQTGLSQFLTLVAFLSLQLGIINLFPIPVLDGGHILFFAIEAVKGSPLSEKFMSIAQQVGVALIVILMALVTYNDITRVFFR
ncbi:MAG: RIP metalloprotease RseP [Deltaproteobacteria bacterium]|nr:RIP metalloprotease RseP [Deltaproteobacteria bacterium]